MHLPLLTRDGRHLATPPQPAWLRRLLVWSVPLAAAGLLAVNSAGTPDATCTQSAPCTADPLGSVVLGLFLASAVVGLVHPGTAAALAAAFAAGALGYDVLHPATASAWWMDAAVIGYAAISLAVARVLRARPGHDVAFDWLARTPYATPPAPARLPGPDRRTLALLVLAVVAAGALLAWGLHRQAEADAQQEAAQVISVEVVDQVDRYTLRVRLPDSSTTQLSVLDAVHHPAGSRLALRVDRAGLRQPVGEEYDASGWYVPAILLAGLALAGVARDRQRRHGLRRLVGQPQPVSSVYVCETWDRLAGYRPPGSGVRSRSTARSGCRGVRCAPTSTPRRSYLRACPRTSRPAWTCRCAPRSWRRCPATTATTIPSCCASTPAIRWSGTCGSWRSRSAWSRWAGCCRRCRPRPRWCSPRSPWGCPPRPVGGCGCVPG